jgi:thioredoxin-like negative regulator of GroEL
VIDYPPLESLIFFFRQGCDSCEEAAPELDKYARSHPRMMVVKVNADGPHPYAYGIAQVNATPLYLFRRGHEGYTHAGALKATQIQKWIDAIDASEERQ